MNSVHRGLVGEVFKQVLRGFFTKLFRADSGVSTAEYTLSLAFVALTTVSALNLTSGGVSETFNQTSYALENSNGGCDICATMSVDASKLRREMGGSGNFITESSVSERSGGGSSTNAYYEVGGSEHVPPEEEPKEGVLESREIGEIVRIGRP